MGGLLIPWLMAIEEPSTSLTPDFTRRGWRLIELGGGDGSLRGKHSKWFSNSVNVFLRTKSFEIVHSLHSLARTPFFFFLSWHTTWFSFLFNSVCSPLHTEAPIENGVQILTSFFFLSFSATLLGFPVCWGRHDFILNNALNVAERDAVVNTNNALCVVRSQPWLRDNVARHPSTNGRKKKQLSESGEEKKANIVCLSRMFCCCFHVTRKKKGKIFTADYRFFGGKDRGILKKGRRVLFKFYFFPRRQQQQESVYETLYRRQQQQPATEHSYNFFFYRLLKRPICPDR